MKRIKLVEREQKCQMKHCSKEFQKSFKVVIKMQSKLYDIALAFSSKKITADEVQKRLEAFVETKEYKTATINTQKCMFENCRQQVKQMYAAMLKDSGLKVKPSDLDNEEMFIDTAFKVIVSSMKSSITGNMHGGGARATKDKISKARMRMCSMLHCTTKVSKNTVLVMKMYGKLQKVVVSYVTQKITRSQMRDKIEDIIMSNKPYIKSNKALIKCLFHNCKTQLKAVYKIMCRKYKISPHKSDLESEKQYFDFVIKTAIAAIDQTIHDHKI